MFELLQKGHNSFATRDSISIEHPESFDQLTAVIGIRHEFVLVQVFYVASFFFLLVLRELYNKTIVYAS